jgi:hypothetical protein
MAELMAALSIATDLGMGQPLESALCSCVVAMRLGEALHLDGDTLRDVFHQALLRYIGCNADANALAALMGDELAPAVPLVTLAQDAVVWTRLGGPDAAVATVRKRSGGAYHPWMAERYCEQAQMSPSAIAVQTGHASARAAVSTSSHTAGIPVSSAARWVRTTTVRSCEGIFDHAVPSPPSHV